jgi:Kdo2-lipid IVA lauroyltransferase/acyltransferase
VSFYENIKNINRAVARNVFYAARWLISHLPYPLFSILTNILIILGRPFLINKRIIAMESLQIAFGREKTQEELQLIAKNCFNNFARGMIDLIYFIDRPKEIEAKVTISGKEYLDQALSGGKGAIIVSAHFGDFILMYLRIILAGYKINVIMRRTRDKEFEQYISDFRQENEIKTIYDLPPRKCVQESLQALRRNELLFILLDQNYGGDSRVFVDFFGHKAATAAGPVVFANRTDSPILPMFILGKGGLEHKIIIDPPIELEQGEESQAFLIRNVAKISKIIEKYVRLYPHEWGGWMHKRWKSRTVDEQRIVDILKAQCLSLNSPFPF